MPPGNIGYSRDCKDNLSEKIERQYKNQKERTMNENWPEIVEDLSPYLATGWDKSECLRGIGNCLRYLGWKKTNGTMVFGHKPVPGDGESVQPDICLCMKNGENAPLPVLPVITEGQEQNTEKRLALFMKRSGFNVALYIGRNIGLYYRVPGGTEEPVRVLSAEFRKDDTEGSAICDLLAYDGFSPEKMERFCKERYKETH